MIDSDLKTSFGGQTLPIHVFMLNDTRATAFTRAFDKQLWSSNFKRFNRGQISNKKIEIEDIRIAKTISGWVNSLKN